MPPHIPLVRGPRLAMSGGGGLTSAWLGHGGGCDHGGGGGGGGGGRRRSGLGGDELCAEREWALDGRWESASANCVDAAHARVPAPPGCALFCVRALHRAWCGRVRFCCRFEYSSSESPDWVEEHFGLQLLAMIAAHAGRTAGCPRVPSAAAAANDPRAPGTRVAARGGPMRVGSQLGLMPPFPGPAIPYPCHPRGPLPRRSSLLSVLQ
jgi:hypothetical protein